MTRAGKTLGGYVVYQMGKVGSSSVYESLLAADLPAPLYKVHYLSDFGVERGFKLYAGLPRQVAIPHEKHTAELRARMRDEPGTWWKVVTLVREPVARDVSAYLQMVDVLHPHLVAGERPQLGRIARAATVQFSAFREETSYTARWFDDEIRLALGIDVYSRPFDRERRRQQIRGPNADLLILRLEDLNEYGEQALSDFLGAPVPLIYKSSRSAEKLQAVYTEETYRELVNRVRLTAGLCERVYATRYAKHFYTAEERLEFTRRWTDG